MNSLRWLFSFHGRFSRGDVWAHQLASGFVSGLLAVGLFFLLPDVWVETIGILPLFGVAIGVGYIALASAWVRRLHDFNLSGWWMAAYPPIVAVFIGGWFNTFGLQAPYDVLSPILFGLFVLTVMALFVFFYLVPGQRHANRFGPVPGDRASATPDA